ncbi:MAG: hypothetical protein U9Q62_04990, partial [Campylobacterota bacterium]|nr:hypothetical protein [Campylobacterota bacterium]
IGLVHESKELSIDKGRQSIVYPGVATTVQTDSVSVTLPGDLILYSQQYRFDKITLNKIIEAHIGKEVRYKSGPKKQQVIKKGTLLASNPAVVETKDGIVSGIAAGDFIFESIPSELIMKPSLVWNVAVPRSTTGMMNLDYLISRISWKSDYILNLHENSGDLTGWVTVDNRSGKRFEEVKLNLLAGDINRASAPQLYADAMRMEKSMAAAPVAHQAHEGYHFYSVPFSVTLANNEKTQVKFIDQPRHKLKRLYDVKMQHPFSTTTEQKRAVSQYVELSKFPMPLPGGIVRTYSKAGDTTVLLGETPLENTPKNEKVKLRIGTNFDLIAKNKLTERSDDSRYYGAKIAYTVTNRSDKSKTVDVDIPGIVERTKHLSTITTELPYTRPDGYTLRFTITLKAGETKTWDVAYRTKKN